jgi:hypothetical protein
MGCASDAPPVVGTSYGVDRPGGFPSPTKTVGQNICDGIFTALFRGSSKYFPSPPKVLPYSHD